MRLRSFARDPTRFSGAYRDRAAHMPPLFTRMLADRLNKQEPAIRVHEAEAGRTWSLVSVDRTRRSPHVRRASGRCCELFAINLARRKIPAPGRRLCCSAPWRESSALTPLAVVLTGMGSDGVLGSRVVRESGGHVYVQDEATSVAWACRARLCRPAGRQRFRCSPSPRK